MAFYKQADNQYIYAISTANIGRVITLQEYQDILSAFASMPEPQEGFGVRLKTDLAWEVYQIPPAPTDEEATSEDYEAALRELGVNV